jgi:dienelactone hydrolase
MLYRLKFTYTVETTIHVDVGRLIIPYLRSLGYESFGCVGFCFGGWAVAQCLALESSPFSAGVGIHPSLNVEDLHRRPVADLAKRVGKTPLLLLPAGNDKREVKPGGVAVRILAESRGVDESEISVEFPDQIHGFVSRGEPSEDQKRAIDKSTEHFIKHLS